MADNNAKVGSIMHMVHASAFAVDFPDFVLKSSSIKVVLSSTNVMREFQCEMHLEAHFLY